MDSPATETLAVPDAPAIPGLAFRPFRDDGDYPALLAVNTGSKIADGLDHDLHTMESIKHAYKGARNHDPARDMLIAEVDGAMIAFSRVYGEPELDGTRTYWHAGFVLPAWRGRGLGHAMIRWAAGRARSMDAGQGAAGLAYAGAEVHANMAGLGALLEAEGYAPVRYEYHMETADLDHIPDVPLPAGLEVRPARPEAYHAIWQASTEAFRDHWGATESEQDDFAGWIKDPLLEPDLWVVAWDGDQVAGSILNYVNPQYNARTGRQVGYTESISVRRPWRRHGLARALLARSMQLHKARGMTQTALGVDTANPSGALRLYESMGYRVVSQSTTYRKAL